MTRTGVALAACLLLSTGYVLPESESQPETSSYRAWVGRYADELVEEWGEPTKIKVKKNGTRVLVFKTRFHVGTQEVNTSGQFFDAQNQPQNSVGPDATTPGAAPATITRGTVGTKKTGKGKTTFRFFADREDRIYEATRKPKQPKAG